MNPFQKFLNLQKMREDLNPSHLEALSILYGIDSRLFEECLESEANVQLLFDICKLLGNKNDIISYFYEGENGLFSLMFAIQSTGESMKLQFSWKVFHDIVSSFGITPSVEMYQRYKIFKENDKTVQDKPTTHKENILDNIIKNWSDSASNNKREN